MVLLHEGGSAIMSAPVEYLWLVDLLVKFSFNTISALIIIKLIYKPTKKREAFTFTYMVFSPLIFFICHLFGNTEISLGFAFGLFAIFSILRYLTTSIPVKEMTYLFIIIGLAVINAIGFSSTSIYELIFINLILVGLIAFLEKDITAKITSQNVYYEKMENLSHDKEEELLQDLQERTGKDILRFEVVESDFINNTTKIKIFYYRDH